MRGMQPRMRMSLLICGTHDLMGNHVCKWSATASGAAEQADVPKHRQYAHSAGGHSCAPVTPCRTSSTGAPTGRPAAVSAPRKKSRPIVPPSSALTSCRWYRASSVHRRSTAGRAATRLSFWRATCTTLGRVRGLLHARPCHRATEATRRAQQSGGALSAVSRHPHSALLPSFVTQQIMTAAWVGDGRIMTSSAERQHTPRSQRDCCTRKMRRARHMMCRLPSQWSRRGNIEPSVAIAFRMTKRR